MTSNQPSDYVPGWSFAEDFSDPIWHHHPRPVRPRLPPPLLHRVETWPLSLVLPEEDPPWQHFTASTQEIPRPRNAWRIPWEVAVDEHVPEGLVTPIKSPPTPPASPPHIYPLHMTFAEFIYDISDRYWMGRGWVRFGNSAFDGYDLLTHFAEGNSKS